MTSATHPFSPFVPDLNPRARRQPSLHKTRKNTLSSPEGRTVNGVKPDVGELRRIRTDFYTTPTPTNRSTRAQEAMAERTRPRRRSSVSQTIPSTKRPEITVREVREDYRPAEHRPLRHRRQRGARAESEAEPVYVYRPTADPPALRRSHTTRVSAHTSRPKEEVWRSSEGITRSYTERRPLGQREEETVIRRVVSVKHRPEPGQRPKGHHDRSPVRRSSSTREANSTLPPRQQSLHRSQTTTHRTRQPSRTVSPPPSIPPNPVSTAPSASRKPARPSSILGSILYTLKPAPFPETRTVECLACLSPYPPSHTALLSCSHRLCHPCLRRIFTLSLTDPQHMPPRCCSAAHPIPLKHVEKLFDAKFKLKWNRKYEEYTTKERLYCPAKGCGAWIPPGNIHPVVATGTGTGTGTGKPKTTTTTAKSAKCPRCKTKVCAACNGLWHGTSRPCQDDAATRQFFAVAKQQGWQRCYNCRATVELKEGCNHMTCRCRAEFCMVCGTKWKGCDCPWFNYRVVAGAEEGNLDPQTYQHQLAARREQELADAALARRLEAMDFVGGPGVEIYRVHDEEEEEEEAVVSFRRTQNVTSYPGTGAAAAVPLRRQERMYNPRVVAPSTAERVVPVPVPVPRREVRYERKAAVHAPVGRAPPVVVGQRSFGGSGGGAGMDGSRGFAEEIRGSALAGLTRGGTAEGRVEEWR
ncbi:MAG: hypothetical protein Q9219_007117, partial [cf. Caloplaca sp. 3 TL-2023]